MRIVSVACDRCETADGKRTVSQYSLRRGTRRWTGELCDKCFDNLIKDWNPSDLPRGHHQIVETKMDEIVKT